MTDSVSGLVESCGLEAPGFDSFGFESFSRCWQRVSTDTRLGLVDSAYFLKRSDCLRHTPDAFVVKLDQSL